MLAEMRQVHVTERPVAASVDELLARATDRRPFLHSDSKSGVGFERVTIDGAPYVLKHIHIDDDWTMRFFHERTCIPLEVWRTGLMDAAPEHIDHGMVGAAGGVGRDGLGATLLMHDLSPSLVPAGDDPLPLSTHVQLLEGMAALSAATWNWPGHDSLLPLANRWLAFGDADIDAERRLGWPNPVPKIAHEGWMRFFERAPAAIQTLIRALRADTTPLVEAVATTPLCFLHGDWKLGNLGVREDGRVVLLDWTYCGRGPICSELGWYLALNAARLPHSKEDTIATLRGALERSGVATDTWWDRQLSLCLLGTLVLFGWEKALGSDEELAWWCDWAHEGALQL